MPLEGLEKEFVFDYSTFAKEKLGNRRSSVRLYPVLSEYLGLYILTFQPALFSLNIWGYLTFSNPELNDRYLITLSPALYEMQDTPFITHFLSSL